MEKETNDTIAETEQLEIDGQIVTVNTLESGTIEVPVPDGLDPAARDQFIADVKEKSKTVGAYYRKLQELNSRLEDPEWQKFKEGQHAQNESANAPDPAESQPKDTALWEDLGLARPGDLADFVVDHPDEYATVVERRAREASRKTLAEEMARQREMTAQVVTESELERQIRDAGMDPKEVRSYAAYLKAPFSAQIFEAYRLRHAPKSDPVVQARLSAQADQVQWIDSSTGRDPIRPETITKDRLSQISTDDLRRVKERLMKLADND